MSWSGPTDGNSGRRGYHHGNLREALIEAALELIGAKGPAGFTIAEAARLAGVSPAAPYRHFRDADALSEAGLFLLPSAGGIFRPAFWTMVVLT